MGAHPLRNNNLTNSQCKVYYTYMKTPKTYYHFFVLDTIASPKFLRDIHITSPFDLKGCPH